MAITTKEELHQAIREMVKKHSDEQNADALINMATEVSRTRVKYHISMFLVMAMLVVSWVKL